MIAEKKLTPAEIKKREEIARAIERDNPNMPMSKKMAIATAQAKKVAESMMREKKRLLLTDEDLEEGSPSFNYAVALATVEEPEKNFVKIGGKNIRKTMDMQTARRIVKDYESQQDEAKQDFNFKAKITDKGDAFEIGGDEFVRESVKPKHRYAYIVENTLNLRKSYETLNLAEELQTAAPVSSINKDAKISKILDLALSNGIDIKNITPINLDQLSVIDLDLIEDDIKKRIEDRKEATIGATSGMITGLLGTWFRTLRGKIINKVSDESLDALGKALKILKDSVNPTSDIGQKIYTTKNITVAAILAASVSASVGGFLLLRRFIRDREQRQLAKLMYGDLGVKGELQQIARRSGLDNVSQRELMLLLPNLENFELSSPQVRRL